MTTTTSISSSNTGTLSSIGLGSGLDAQTIIDKLTALEMQPVTQLQTQETGLKTKLSAYGQLQSQISALQDKVQALSSTTLWGQTSVSSGDSSVVSGTTAGSNVPAGSYAVSVQSLAAAQTVTSGSFASSSSTLGTGTLTIELGSWNNATTPPGFTSQSGASPVSLTIDSADTSLASIRDKINAAGAGVTASIINDANGARLSLSSRTTGAVNGFRIGATGGLSALAYDPSTTGSQMTLNQSAANAQATINGIQVQSTTNTLTNVSDGLSLTLSQVSSTPVQLTVSANTDAVNTAVNDFVKAFNSLATLIQSDIKYDAGSKTGGPLVGDSTAGNLQWALRGIINQGSTASSMFSHLSDIGISMQEDGTLKVDATKLSNGLANQGELRKLFTADTGENASSGFMTRFNQLATSLLDINGSITTRQQGLQKSIDDNEKRQASITTRVNNYTANLQAQYQALDTKMASLNALSAYVAQQFGNKSSSSG